MLTKEINDLLEQFPDARNYRAEEKALLSIAISLKKIAEIWGNVYPYSTSGRREAEIPF